MKKLISFVLLALFLTSCEVVVIENTTEITTAYTTAGTIETSNNIDEPLSPESSKERQAEMLAAHIVEYAIAHDLDVCNYAFSSQDLFYFLVSLGCYDENAEHPYSDMISLSDDGMFFEISLERFSKNENLSSASDF